MKNNFARFFTFLLATCFAILNFSSQAEAKVEGFIAPVVLVSENGTCKYDSKFGEYISEKMQENGFQVMQNDALNAYLIKHANDSDLKSKLRLNSDAGQFITEEEFLLRGYFSNGGVKKIDGELYQATATVLLEIFNLNSDKIEKNIEKTFTASAKSESEAKSKVQELAVTESVKFLAK